MKWDTKRFSQIIRVAKGQAITRAGEEEGPYPVILGGQEPAYYINRYNHEGKAIVVSRSGASAGFASFWNEPIFITDGFLVEPLPNNSTEYVFYLFKYYGKVLRDLQNGSAIPHVTPKTIYSLRAPIPPEKEQSRIAEVLSAYDNLIEVNYKRIKVLEQMAENLYKEWFVRFRFPGHETAEFENGIPKGWTIKRLGDYGRVETGKTPSMEVSEYYGDDYLFIKTPEMHGNVFVIDTEEKLSRCGHLSQPKKLLPANSIMVTCIGTGGVVAINAEPGHTNQQINSIILDDLIYLEWLFFTCRSMRTTIELFGATGSTMTNLSKGKFEKLKVIEPSTALIEEFHKITESMLKEIEKLMRANQKLACQRDLILPRLMSGKLEV